jgi:putative addiction module component (TIGR02574 family)
MSGAAKKILDSALSLPPDDREYIADQFWDSLEHGDDEASVEKAWEAELARRSKEIDEGRAEFVSWEDVKAQLGKRLGEK